MPEPVLMRLTDPDPMPVPNGRESSSPEGGAQQQIRLKDLDSYTAMQVDPVPSRSRWTAGRERAERLLSARGVSTHGNPFEMLTDGELEIAVPCPYDIDDSAPSAPRGAWATLTMETLRAIRTVGRMIADFHDPQGLPSGMPPPGSGNSDRAARIKQLLMLLAHERRPRSPKGAIDWPWPELATRIRVVKKLYRGEARVYLQVRGVRSSRCLLTLCLPKAGEWCSQFADRQATFQDDRFDTYCKGVRINRRAILGEDLTREESEDILWGTRAKLLHDPPPCQKDNYPTCREPRILDPPGSCPEGRHMEELAKWKQSWLEGPLLYEPDYRAPMGGIYKVVKDKYRIVTDGTAIGVNAAHQLLNCRLDAVEDVVQSIEQNDWMTGIDGSDYFLLFAQSALDADLFSLRDPDTAAQDWRPRFYLFGGQQAPAVAQRWSVKLKALINENGLRYCEPGTPESDYSTFKCVGAYIDDFKMRHASRLTQEQANAQLRSVIRYLTDLGVAVHPNKIEWAATEQDYLGVTINTVKQCLMVSSERRERYARNIQAILDRERVPAAKNWVLDLQRRGGSASMGLDEITHRIEEYGVLVVTEKEESLWESMASHRQGRGMMQFSRFANENDMASRENAPSAILLASAGNNPGQLETLRRQCLYWRGLYPSAQLYVEAPAPLQPDARWWKSFERLEMVLGAATVRPRDLWSAELGMVLLWGWAPDSHPSKVVPSARHVALRGRMVNTDRLPFLDNRTIRQLSVWDSNWMRGDVLRPTEIEAAKGLPQGVMRHAPSEWASELAARCSYPRLYEAAFKHAHAATDGGIRVPRIELASVIGQIQWVSVVDPPLRQLLADLYPARDSFENPRLAEMHGKAPWLPRVRVRLSQQDESTLRKLQGRILQETTRPLDLHPGDICPGLWDARRVELDDDFDRRQPANVPGTDIAVVTTDASGFGGGAWWGPHRYQHDYHAPRLIKTTSNFREANTFCNAVEHFGKMGLEGQPGKPLRVLGRLDNSVFVAVINKRSCRAPRLRSCLERLHEIEQKFHLRVSARHLSGKLNWLADGISRWKVSRDGDNWMLNPKHFQRICQLVGTPDVDANADPLGLNAQVPRYWSVVEDCFDQQWQGLRVYINPAYTMLLRVMEHARLQYARAPDSTELICVLPVWSTGALSWWRYTKGMRVLARFPAGSSGVFTSPEWREEHATMPRARVDRGPASFDVILTYLPATRTCRRSGTLARDNSDGKESGGMLTLPRLSGDMRRDRGILYTMPPGFVL